jgi:pimeloyl-ACP methyl ester carboxylesterase
MKHYSVYLGGFFMVMGLVLTACAPFKPAPISTSTVVPPTPTPTIIPPTPTPVSGKIDVGGYQLRIQCYGQGTPTVIVESGLGDPPVGNGSWFTVTSAIQKNTQICIYDRAGIGFSDAPEQSQSIRTSQDMVNDLHTLLVNANVPAPYLLVGHSLGGYNVRLYASQYPKEVVGIVLVDSAHPDQWSELSAVLPPTCRPSTDPYSNPERMDLIASADQVRAIKTLGDLPLVVVTRAPGLLIPCLSPELSAKSEQIWQDLQLDLTGLSSNSTHMIATLAGHKIHVDEPQLVIKAILKAMDEAKR